MLIRLLQWLPEFKGKTRLSRWLLRNYVINKKNIVIAGADGLRYKVPNFIEPIGFSILVNGVHEKETSDFIREQLPENGVFVDVGANIGAVTIPVFNKRKDIRVMCIEASPKVFTFLSENVLMNKLDDCILVNKAITEKDGERVRFFSPDDQHGKGSLSPVFTDKSEEVETITLDTLFRQQHLNKIDFIKIDIEGHEYFAFKSAEQTLKQNNAPTILFEFIDWAESHANNLKPGDAQRLLMQYGYNLYLFEKGKPVGQPLKEAVTTGGLTMLLATKKMYNNR